MIKHMLKKSMVTTIKIRRGWNLVLRNSNVKLCILEIGTSLSNKDRTLKMEGERLVKCGPLG
jgi:hypothetical protein